MSSIHRFNTANPIPALLLAMLLALLGPASICLAQQAPAERTPRQMLADQFIMQARMSLEGSGEVRQDQLIRARMLMELALSLNNQDPEIWRLAAELAQKMEDNQLREQALQRYTQLVPDDDVVQLKLIRERLTRMQTIEERIERIDRLVNGPAAAQLSEPVRSRLATYAAVAAQEKGDREQLARWLRLATSLDPTNLDAAVMTYQQALEAGASPQRLAATTIMVIRAEPGDAGVRLQLATQLLEQAAYQQSIEQFEMSANLRRGPLPPEYYQQVVLSMAAAGRHTEALQLLRQIESFLNQQDQQAQTPAQSQDNNNPTPGSSAPGNAAPAGPDDGNAPDADTDQDNAQPDAPGTPDAPDAPDTGLPMGLKLLRLAILFDNDTLAASPDHWQPIHDRLQQRIERGDPQAALDLAWIAAVFCHDLDVAREKLAQVEADHHLAKRARAWITLREGDRDAAMTQFREIAREDGFAQFGVAMLLSNQPDRQMRLLQAIIHADPTSLPALLSARTMRQNNVSIDPTPTGREIVEAMERLPRRLWQADLSVMPWVALSMRLPGGRFHYLEPVTCIVSLRNSSQMPLAIGPGRTIPGNFMLIITPSIAGRSLGSLQPQGVDTQRRLRLNPGETLDIPLRLDHTILGWMSTANPYDTFTINLTGILGPRLTQTGGIAPRTTGGTTSVRNVQMIGIFPTAATVERWQQTLADGTPTEQMRAIARLVKLPGDQRVAEMEAALLRDIETTLEQRFTNFDPVRQAWTILMIRPAEPDARRPYFRQVLNLAQRSDEPMVRLAYLAGHVRQKDDQALAAAIRHNDPVISGFARAIRAAFEAGQEPIPDPLAPNDIEPDATPDATDLPDTPGAPGGPDLPGLPDLP